MADTSDYLDAFGNWTGTQADLGHEVPESADAFPGSLTVDDQEKSLRGSVPAGPTTRVKDFDDDYEGLRAASRASADIPVTAAGEKVTVEGKKAESDKDAAPLAAPATSEAPAEDVADGGTTKARSRKGKEAQQGGD